MITRLDGDIGSLMTLLKELKLEENTIVFFTSDNGPHKEGGQDPEFFDSNGFLRGIKRDLYDGGIRVPMFVRWAGKIKPNQTSDQVWHFADFLPTAAALADAKPPANLDGVSVLPMLLGKRQPPHPPLYWEFYEGRFQQAVRTGDWKMINPGAGKPVELYDLRRDPGENDNVAARHPEVAERMERIMRMAHTDSLDWNINVAPPSSLKTPALKLRLFLPIPLRRANKSAFYGATY